MNARPEFFVSSLAQVDPELFAVVQSENQRQEDHIELIASENYASKAVMEAQGSSSPINTPKAIRAVVTTEVVSSLTSPKRSRLIA